MLCNVSKLTPAFDGQSRWKLVIKGQKWAKRPWQKIITEMSGNTTRLFTIHAPSATSMILWLSILESMVYKYIVCLCRLQCCLKRASIFCQILSLASLGMRKLQAQTTRMDLSSWPLEVILSLSKFQTLMKLDFHTHGNRLQYRCGSWTRWPS